MGEYRWIITFYQVLYLRSRLSDYVISFATTMIFGCVALLYSGLYSAYSIFLIILSILQIVVPFSFHPFNRGSVVSRKDENLPAGRRG